MSRLLVDTLTGAVLAPNAAVQLGATGSFVYVVKDDSTVAVRKVTTGPADATNTAIVSGLAAGENVVIDGVDRLRDGAKVSVRNGAARRRKIRRRQAPRAGAGTAPASAPADHRRRRRAQPAPSRDAMIATRTGSGR